MNQKAKLHFGAPRSISAGDIVQCPKCHTKFIILPHMILWSTDRPVVLCPECKEGSTDLEYFAEAKWDGWQFYEEAEPKTKKKVKNGHKENKTAAD